MLETPVPVEHVVRGTFTAALAIPIGIALFAILGGLGYIAGIVAALVPVLAAWLYRFGAGRPLTAAGFPGFLLVTAVGVGLGIFTGLVSGFLMTMPPVPPFSPHFWDAFLDSFASGSAFEMVWLPTLVGIALAVVGVIGVLRGLQQSEEQAL